MALSNIFREPRREITESAVGLAVFGAFVGADYFVGRLAISLLSHHEAEDFAWYWCLLAGFIGLIAGVLCGILLGGVLEITHELGDDICNSLARRGLEIRPKNRPGRR